MAEILQTLAGLMFGVVVALGMVAGLVAVVGQPLHGGRDGGDEPCLPRKPRLPKGGGR